MASDALILPGVGAFWNALSTLHRLDLVKPIRLRGTRSCSELGGTVVLPDFDAYESAARRLEYPERDRWRVAWWLS